MKSHDKTLWEDLVIAILSVNQYSLEKTYSAIDGIRREGLSIPPNLGRWTAADIELQLRRAGLDRGQFMTRLFAERLSSVGKFLASTGIENCRGVLSTGTPGEIKKLLLPVKGIGPKVLANFFLLRGIKDDSTKTNAE